MQKEFMKKARSILVHFAVKISALRPRLRGTLKDNMVEQNFKNATVISCSKYCFSQEENLHAVNLLER